MGQQRKQGPALLIVEDNEITREGMAAVLRRAGYHVSLAADGAQALAHLADDPLPDLILLDMLMPSLDGWRFLEERRHDRDLRAIPVIIVTALGVASADWAASLGAVGFVTKPVETEDLLAVVRHCLPANSGESAEH